MKVATKIKKIPEKTYFHQTPWDVVGQGTPRKLQRKTFIITTPAYQPLRAKHL